MCMPSIHGDQKGYWITLGLELHKAVGAGNRTKVLRKSQCS